MRKTNVKSVSSQVGGTPLGPAHGHSGPALHNPVHTVQHNKILCKNYAVKGAMFSAMPRAMLGAM